MKSSTLVAAVLAAASLVSSARARADIGPSPPSECPPGAVGTTTKSNGFCSPGECATDAECPPKTDIQSNISHRAQTVTYVCKQAGLCIESKELTDHTKVWPIPDGEGMRFKEEKVKRNVAVSACTQDGNCAAGVKCDVRARCLEVTRTYKDDGAPVPFFKPQAASNESVVKPVSSVTPMPALSSEPSKPAAKCGCVVGMESSAPVPWYAALFMLSLIAARAARARASVQNARRHPTPFGR